MKKYKAMLSIGNRWHEWVLVAKDHNAAKAKAFRKYDVKAKDHWMFGTREIK